MPGCAFGPCNSSVENGGAGCDLCDRVAKLPECRLGYRRHVVEQQAQQAEPKKKEQKVGKKKR